MFVYETSQLNDSALQQLTSNLSTAALFTFANDSNAQLPASGQCKTYPGDPEWPSSAAWNDFDTLLGGALIRTKPLASACYRDWGDYDAAECAWITANWANNSYFQTSDPTSINAELYQNSTCLPPGVWPYAQKCSLGSYPSYSVNVTTVTQIQLAINFARNSNLRLVVKNTGHDFNAKSTGAGGLNIWTHNLKDYVFYDEYSTGDYTGSAAKLGAGVQAYEMYAACQEYGVTCVGGEGRTVGVMGGYIQGGGHSPLSSIFGMAADQALAFEVVTPDGRFITADGTQNSDLFWALRGGGGGTFGVVTSVIVKTHPRMPVSFITFAISNTANVSTDAFFAAFEAYWNGFPTWTAAGTYSYYFVMPLAAGLYQWEMTAWFAPNMTAAQLQSLTEPLFTTWKALGIDIQPVYQEYDNFYDAWYAAFPLETWGTNLGRQSSRLFPRSNWDNSSIQAETFAAIRLANEAGYWVFGFHMAPGLASYPDNAVNPAWREALSHSILMIPWDASLWANGTGIAQIETLSDDLTFVWCAKWRELTPGSGAYMSEADYIEPNFQQAFWGGNYERLYALKQTYDPTGLFFAQQAVGSEDWALDELILGNLPSQAGRLCRV